MQINPGICARFKSHSSPEKPFPDREFWPCLCGKRNVRPSAMVTFVVVVIELTLINHVEAPRTSMLAVLDLLHT